MPHKIDSLSIAEVAKNFDIFVDYCDERREQTAHVMHSNIVDSTNYQLIKELVKLENLHEMFFVKSYKEKMHADHVNQYVDHGYGAHNTKMMRGEIADNEVITNFMQDHLKIKHGRAKINSQPPGNFFPVHIDYLAGWTKHNPELAKKYSYPQFKRFILFLTPRANGHFYSINNCLIDYKEGDIVEQLFFSWHATGNGDLTNKVLIAFEGIAL